MNALMVIVFVLAMMAVTISGSLILSALFPLALSLPLSFLWGATVGWFGGNMIVGMI